MNSSRKSLSLTFLPPLSGFLAGRPVNYLGGSPYTPNSIRKAAVPGVVREILDEPFFDGLKDGIKEIVLNIG